MRSNGSSRNPSVVESGWTCPGCRQETKSRFCPTCGETDLHPRDLTLRGMLDQAVRSLTNLDGRVLRSLRVLVVRPGTLTTAYLRGRRRPYLLPLPLFLFVNVVFFALQSVTDLKVFSTPLDVHLYEQMWSGVAASMLDAHLAATHRTMVEYAPLFDHAIAQYAKTLIGVMVLPFSLLLAALYRRRPQPAVAHLVFSLHLFAFLLLLFCGALIVSGGLAAAGFETERTDHQVSLMLVLASAAYLFVATREVYGSDGVLRIAEVAVLTTGMAAIVLGYRFMLFVLTLYSI